MLKSSEITHFNFKNKLSTPIPSEILEVKQTQDQELNKKPSYIKSQQQYNQLIQEFQKKKKYFDRSEQEKSTLCILAGIITVEVCKEINYSRRSTIGITPQQFMDLSNNDLRLHIPKEECDLIVAHVQSVVKDAIETLNMYRSNAQIQAMIETKAHTLMENIGIDNEIEKGNNSLINEEPDIKSSKWQEELGIRDIQKEDNVLISFIIDSIHSNRQPVITWSRGSPDYVDDSYLFDNKTNDDEE
ncbi:MAG: hypothetical protein EZS28_007800 [Streblomastix strix]|uniref:Uncharacterized protein n=1 Tax=Streblomastix strix TaxID=222440 RepID=A0A5J4WP17_9EUKA|nr:MAG: hypothetical protein EZS28_007800 [Streblomastix strix]